MTQTVNRALPSAPAAGDRWIDPDYNRAQWFWDGTRWQTSSPPEADIIITRAGGIAPWRASYSPTLGRFLICDGVNDYVEIQAAITDLWAAGRYVGTIEVLDDVDIGDTTVDVDGHPDGLTPRIIRLIFRGLVTTSSAISAIRVGNTLQVGRGEIVIPRIAKGGAARAAGSKALEIIRGTHMQIYLGESQNWEYDLHINCLSGVDANGNNGCTNNDIYLSIWNNAERGLRIEADGVPNANNAEANRIWGGWICNSYTECAYIGANAPHTKLSGLEIDTVRAGATGLNLVSGSNEIDLFMLQTVDPANRLLGAGVATSRLRVRNHDSQFDHPRMQPIIVPTNASWQTGHAGGGGGTPWTTFQTVETAAVASTGLFWTSTMGLAGAAGVLAAIDWSKKLILEFELEREASVADVTARFQLKSVNTEGALAAAGIGVRADNLTLYGESYGVALGVVDLATLLVSERVVKVRIECYLGIGAPRIEWWINDVLMGVEATANNIPTGVTNSRLVHSIITPGGGVAYCHVGNIRIRQE